MARFVEQQLSPLPLPETREPWLAARAALRQRILQILGIDDLMPPRWNLHVRSRGVLKRPGYRIEKITFESYRGLAVPALLYVPEGITGPAPGIVSIAGHCYGTGKATDFLQQRNVNLALRGCVVLAYDYTNCGERSTGPDPIGGKHLGGGNDHGISSFSFSRRTATALDVLDAVRALDVLASRPEVDPARLGFTGESGGGNSTYWIAAVDDRVRLAVPVSSVTTFDYWIRNDRNWDWHQRPPGIRRFADIGTLLALHAPAPLLVISSLCRTDDHEFPVEEAEKSVAWARHVYHLLGADDAIAHVESVTGHGYQEDKRRHLYRWVERWLAPPSPRGDVDLPAQIESLDDLRCGLPPRNRTARDVYAEWLGSLPRPLRGQRAEVQSALRAFLRERLGFPDPLPPVKAERAGDEADDAGTAESWVFEPEPGIRLPGMLLEPADASRHVVLVPGRDEAAVARALTEGHHVFAFDPRGSGEIPDGGGMLRNWAWFAGRPPAGMWALDIVQAARLCRDTFGAQSVSVDAQNRFGWAALLAGAAAPEAVQSGTVTVPMSSFHDYLRARGDAAVADVPGLLEHLDIPQLRALWPQGDVRVEQPEHRPSDG